VLILIEVLREDHTVLVRVQRLPAGQADGDRRRQSPMTIGAPI
jgi:hypothetical protein